MGLCGINELAALRPRNTREHGFCSAAGAGCWGKRDRLAVEVLRGASFVHAGFGHSRLSGPTTPVRFRVGDAVRTRRYL